MIKQINPLHVVLERLGCTDPAKGAFFFWDEVKEWPSGALDMLVISGLLQPAQPMTTIECDGCEQNCMMPVTVYPAQEGKLGLAFITCDKRDDMGRVRVDFRRMEQWQTTGGLIAAVLAKSLGLSQPSAHAVDGRQWRIGTLNGNKHKSSVTLLAGDSLTLSLAGYTVQLVEVFTIEENAIALDKAALIRLVDNPAGGSEALDTEEVSDLGNGEAERYAAAILKPAVSAMQIMLHFVVINSDEDANCEWWKKMMRNASDTGLKECRVGGGKKGRGGSLWRADLVAGWVVDRHERNFEGMSKNAVRVVLKKFSGYEGTAEEFFPGDE